MGDLKYGTLERKGVLGFSDDQRDYDDAVEGIVQMLRGENPSDVLDRIHVAVDELNEEVLPPGVKIHPYLDRTDLVFLRRPVLPLNQEEKDWIALGLERSQLPSVDMEQYK